MRKVLLSLHPEWCKEIFVTKRKVIEVRKTAPKLELPFEVLVYQTKHKGKSIVSEILNGVYGGGKVIGSFVCDKIYTFITFGMGAACIDSEWNQIPPEKVTKETCLSEQQIMDYLERGIGNYEGYGWRIKEPKLYDEPKELGKFIRGCDDMLDPRFGSYCGYCPHPCFLTRPPQSWCYIEV